MPTRNVFLTEHFDALIASGIEQGRYSNASEVVREGLRLLEQRDEEDRARLVWLREAVQPALDAADRGEGDLFTSDEALSSYMQSLVQQVITQPATENV